MNLRRQVIPELTAFLFRSFSPFGSNRRIRGECDRAQTLNLSSASKLSSECLVTYLCVLSAPEYFMMSKLLRKCSQRHPRVQFISDAFWERFKEPRVPLQWCLRRKTTPVSSSLSLFLGFSWSSVLSQKNSTSRAQNVSWEAEHEWILCCKYCTFTMSHCWKASWDRQEKASFTADCKLKCTKLSHHLQHKPPHLFFTVQHHPAAHRPKTITQSLRLPAQDAYRGTKIKTGSVPAPNSVET